MKKKKEMKRKKNQFKIEHKLSLYFKRKKEKSHNKKSE